MMIKPVKTRARSCLSSIKTLLDSQLANNRPIQFRGFILFLCLVFLLRNQSSPSRTSDNSVQVKEKRLELSSTGASPKAGPCPPPDPTIDQRYVGFPQNLSFGEFRSETGKPFLTQDFWADIVDDKRTFVLRPSDRGKPPAEQIARWIRSRPYPIALVINNQMDESWPPHLGGKQKYEFYLNETNLHAVYAGNPRHLPQYPKLQPIPIGLKWTYSSTKLFGDSKENRTKSFRKYGASSPAQSKGLFHLQNRTSTVFWRPMTLRSNADTTNYVRNTPALKASRRAIPAIVNKIAKHSMVFAPNHMAIADFFGELKKHRFVISPPGNGLDTHATWEALLCGCIPIVPHSALDPVFEDLPVWLVDSWEEVTDASVKEQEEYFKDKTYKWEKLYQSYWEERIYDGLCTV